MNIQTVCCITIMAVSVASNMSVTGLSPSDMSQPSVIQRSDPICRRIIIRNSISSCISYSVINIKFSFINKFISTINTPIDSVTRILFDAPGRSPERWLTLELSSSSVRNVRIIRMQCWTRWTNQPKLGTQQSDCLQQTCLGFDSAQIGYPFWACWAVALTWRRRHQGLTYWSNPILGSNLGWAAGLLAAKYPSCK